MNLSPSRDASLDSDFGARHWAWTLDLPEAERPSEAQREAMLALLAKLPPVLSWGPEGLSLLDQRQLPGQVAYLKCTSAAEVAEAIQKLVVRGAPAIGVAAAYGLALAGREAKAQEAEEARAAILAAGSLLKAARPTAVNLAWAVDQVLTRMPAGWKGHELAILTEAVACDLHEADLAANLCLSWRGASLLKDGDTVITHCNAGHLATSGFGTALGVIYAATAQGKKLKVLADETRPVLQGARLTAFELMAAGVDVTLIADGMAASYMARHGAQAVLVGADRIAADGSVANKVGTYGLAVAAARHGVPVYVAAPWSTVDLACPTGEGIPIEERGPEELREVQGQATAPVGVPVWNPAFDLTPPDLVQAILTELGVVEGDLAQGLAALAA